MNPLQFTTIEEAKAMLNIFGPLGFGGHIMIPEYAMGGATPKFDETHLFHFIQFGNLFVSNCGLLKNTIAQRGSEMAAKAAVKAEMIERGLFVPWWV